MLNKLLTDLVLKSYDTGHMSGMIEGLVARGADPDQLGDRRAALIELKDARHRARLAVDARVEGIRELLALVSKYLEDVAPVRSSLTPMKQYCPWCSKASPLEEPQAHFDDCLIVRVRSMRSSLF